jgi:manganese transport protein
MAQNKAIIDTRTISGKWRKILAFLGPAYLVSIGYMDPGNWATDIAAGSRFGYALIWVIVVSNLIAILVQSHSARLGLVTGKDLAQFSRSYYNKRINFVMWILAEIAIAATDLAEVLGMAIGLNLLFGLQLTVGVIISLFDTFLLMFLLKKGIRQLEAFIIALISIIGFSFVIELFFSKPEISSIFSGLIPVLPGNGSLYIAIGIIGATIMPHNLYLHSSLVQTRRFDKTHEGVAKAIKFNLFDTTIALNLALFVNTAILILAASAFYTTGHHEIDDIMQAHKMLVPILGSVLAPILFAVALIASGQSSTLTGTLTGQIIMEGYLNLRIQPWLRRLITRSLAVIPAFILILIAGNKMAGVLLIFSQVILSLQLGFALIPLLHWVSSKKIMGNFKISLFTKIISWFAVGIIVVLNIGLVIDFLKDIYLHGFFTFTSIFVSTISTSAILFLGYITFEPILRPHKVQNLIPTHHAPIEIVLQKNKDYKRIAVTVDFSEADSKALNCAVTQGGTEAEYILIHIVESAGARTWNNENSDTETDEDGAFIFKYSEALTRKNYKNTTIIDFGIARNVLPEVVKKANADLLIMSSHGEKNIFHRILKGQTISNVQRKIEIPVLILK